MDLATVILTLIGQATDLLTQLIASKRNPAEITAELNTALSKCALAIADLDKVLAVDDQAADAALHKDP